MLFYLSDLAAVAEGLLGKKDQERLSLLGNVVQHTGLQWFEASDGRLAVALDQEDTDRLQRLSTLTEIEPKEVTDPDLKPPDTLRLCPHDHPVEPQLGGSAAREGKIGRERYYGCTVCRQGFPESRTRKTKAGKLR